MKNLLALAAAGVTALFAQATFAEASAPVSRADVKAETRALERSGSLTPAGQGAAPMAPSTAKSTTTLAERKAETLQARKEGKLVPAGPQADYPKASASRKTRAERKAEARAAVKERSTVPAGEGPTAPTK